MDSIADCRALKKNITEWESITTEITQFEQWKGNRFKEKRLGNLGVSNKRYNIYVTWSPGRRV